LIESRTAVSLILLNKLHETYLETLFPNVCIGLKTFCTLLVSVATAGNEFQSA